MIPVILAAAAVVQVVGSVVSHLIEQGRFEEAERMMDDAYRKYGKSVQLPPIEDFKAQVLGQTKLAGVKADATAENAQYDTLAKLQGYTNGQLNAQDQANLSRAQMDAGRMSRNARESALRQMRNRGLSASGSELAMSQRGAQDASNALLQSGMDANAMASQRAYQAMMDRGGFAGNLRAQKYGEDARAAEAQDAIDKFNSAARERAQLNNYNKRMDEYRAKLAERDFQMKFAAEKAGRHWSNDSTQRLVGNTANAVSNGLIAYGANMPTAQQPAAAPASSGPGYGNYVMNQRPQAPWENNNYVTPGAGSYGYGWGG